MEKNKNHNSNCLFGKINKTTLKHVAILLAILLIAIIPQANNVSASTTSFINDSTTSRYGKIIVSPDQNLIEKIGEIIGIGEEPKPTAVYELIKNTEFCQYSCEAEGNATLYSDQKLFDGAEFKDNGGNTIAINNYDILIFSKTEDNYIDVPDTYEKECFNLNNKDRTEYCYDKPKTYKKINQPIEIWEKYNGEILPAGDYRWKIKGTKQAFQTVDFVFLKDGVEFIEWAWWAGVTPSGYWKFENDLTDASGNGLTLSKSGGAGTIFDAVHKKLGAYTRYYDGTGSDNVGGSGGSDFDTKPFTIAFWINTTSTGKAILSHSNHWLDAGAWGITYGGGTLDFQISGSSPISYATALNDGSWHRVVYTRTGTGANQFILYLDGLSVATGTLNTNLTDTTAGLALHVGGHSEVAFYIGNLDDVVVINGTAWTADDVTYDYNGGSGIELDRLFNVTLNPLKNTILNASISNFNISSTNATLYIWNDTAGIVYTNTTANLTGTFNQTTWDINNKISPGNYTWNVQACGVEFIQSSFNCSFALLNGSFTYGTPRLNITTPSGILYMPPYNSFDLNYSTLGSTDLSNCSYSYNGAANVSYSCSVNFTGINVTKLGLNNITLYINNTMSFSNSSTRYFYVEPTFSLCNGTYSRQMINYSFKDEATDTAMNASINTNTQFVYWYDSTNINQTYLYSNTTDNYNYNFCIYPNYTANLTISPTIKYSSSTYSATSYPQRTYTISPTLYSNGTGANNVTLFLLSSTSGIYVTVITQASGGAILTGTSVVVTTTIGGTPITIANGLTDASGGVTFFLNPNTPYTFTASHAGYDSVTNSITPTQSTYTIILGTSSINAIYYQSLLEGMMWGSYPPSGLLRTGTYNFSFIVNFPSTTGLPLQNCSLAFLDRSKNIVNITYNFTNSSDCFVQYSNYYFNESRFGMFSVQVNGTWIILDGDSNWVNYAPRTTGTTLSDFFSTATALPEWGNNPQTNDFSRICFFFLIVAIILAGVNFYTNYDSLYPGSSIYIVWGLITFATFCNGFQGPGYFYMDNLTNLGGFNSTAVDPTSGIVASAVINNIIIWVMSTMVMFSATIMNMKRNEGS